MKIFVVLFCIVAASKAIPLTVSTKEVVASKFDSNGPQPVDEVIAITNGEEEESSKRVARHYGYGGYGYGYPAVIAVQPVYYGGYGRRWGGGYGRGWRRHRHYW